MKSILKWIGIVLGGLIGLLLIASIVLHFVGKSKLVTAPEVTRQPVTVPPTTDTEAIARGKQWVNIACTDCHGENLAGTVFIDNEMGVTLIAPNLTGGEGGIGSDYTDEDWELALRHGVGKDGRPLIIMPSADMSNFSNADTGNIIAYLKTILPVDGDLPPSKIGFPGSVLFGMIIYNEIIGVDRIDHASVGSKPALPEGATAVYGRYLVAIAGCQGCHAENFAGLTEENGPSPGPNITPGGALQSWSEQDFITTMRTGVTPSGHELSDDMPWQSISKLSNEYLQAIWAYLSDLPPLPSN
ncbi:MAG: cytochrome c [Chloroflexi bacterium]|nr:cytochrome c [Chloroflexota bacterium]